MFLHLKGGKQSYKVRNHILSSDSTSSDEYMYEDIESPEKTNQIQGNEEQKEAVNAEQQSEGELSNREDQDGDGLWEGEEGEDEIDLDYGEEQNQEELSIQGEDID